MAASPEKPVPSTTLHLGDRTLIVEATPLAKSRQTRLGTIIGQPCIDALKMKPSVLSFWSWLLIVILVVSAPPVAFFVGLYLRELSLIGVQLAVAGAYAFLGVCILIVCGPRSAKISRNRVTLQISRLFRIPAIRSHVMAIQLLPGRADEDLRGTGPSLQLNLILDNPEQPRVGFITFRDAEWTRQAGRKLANYLQVPLIDQLPAPAAEEAVP